MLEHAGREPGFLIGGIPQDFGVSARLGEQPFFVIEADEYDTAFFDKRSKFVHYRPRTAILNNLELDHADIFPDLAAIETQFHHFVRTLPASGLIVVNGRDEALDRVLERGCYTPLERFGVKLMSIGFLLEDDKSAVVWRGPMLHGALMQFISDVDWGELDYLVVDLPPGTGDVQLSLSQLTKVSGGVIVTTPQEVALIDAERAADMFRKLQVPVLGVLENMSAFLCPHCGKPTPIFGEGGGRRLAERLKTRFLGEIPLTLALRESGDRGVPVLAQDPEGLEAQAFLKAARELAAALSVQTFLPLPMA